jgi:hypothetical protein
MWIRAAFLLWFLAGAPAVLTDNVVQLPAEGWRWVRFEIRQRPAVVEARFQTVGGGSARTELISVEELELLRQGKVHDTLASTGTLEEGGFNRLMREPGEYAVVVQNPGGSPVAAHLTVRLDFRAAMTPVVRYLPPERRLMVILISCGVFFAIVGLSARALLRAIRVERSSGIR